MKKIFVGLMCVMMCLSFVTIAGCKSSDSVVRIHIRANSNSDEDQSVKLKVRDEVVEYISDRIEGCEGSDEVLEVLESNLSNLEKIANKVLSANGYTYSSSASIDYEYFPSRDYDGVTFPADYYNALIIRLGSGTGDNWWCVAYPPLCFVGEENTGEKVRYKSKLLELLGL